MADEVDIIDTGEPAEDVEHQTDDQETILVDPEEQVAQLSPAEKRRQRGINREKQWKEELEAERQARLAAETEAARLRGIQEGRQQAQQAVQQQYQRDPIEDALETNFKAQQALDKEFQARQGRLTQEEQDDMQRRYMRLNDERNLINAERARRAQPQVNPEVQQIEAYAAVNHPEIINDPAATLRARAEIVELAKKYGRVDQKVVAEALELTERKMKIGKYRNGNGVDPGLTTRLSGNGRGAGATSPGANVGDGRIVMTPRLKAMAEAAYAGDKVDGKPITPQQAWQKWAQGPGARLLKAGIRPDRME